MQRKRDKAAMGKQTTPAEPAELSDEELARPQGGTTLTANQTSRGVPKSWSTAGGQAGAGEGVG